MSTTSAPLVIGLLHPGAMGAVLGALWRRAGQDVIWCAEGRSSATRDRAVAAGLREVPSLAELCSTSDLVVSVAPPHAARDVAQAVSAQGFTGIYLDANAVSPARAREIASVVQDGGARFLDGGIVGPPPTRPTTTWLHLSGPDAGRIAAALRHDPLSVEVVSDEVGDASAVKMAWAAWSKGSTALRSAILAYAETLGVGDRLDAQWEAVQPGFWQESRERATRVTAKAWRFEGEMHEIADAFDAAGVPGGFHRTAAEVYRRIAPLRASSDVSVHDVVSAIAAPDEDDGPPA